MTSTTQPHHYFGSTFSNWATGATRAEVIAKLAKQVRADDMKRAVSSFGGIFVFTCRVDLPERSTYSIDNFRPVGVPMGDNETARIITTRGATAPDT